MENFEDEMSNPLVEPVQPEVTVKKGKNGKSKPKNSTPQDTVSDEEKPDKTDESDSPDAPEE